MQRAAMARLSADDLAAERLGLFYLTRIKQNPGIGKSILEALFAGFGGFYCGIADDRGNPFVRGRVGLNPL